jgi:hypothetical protein
VRWAWFELHASDTRSSAYDIGLLRFQE